MVWFRKNRRLMAIAHWYDHYKMVSKDSESIILELGTNHAVFNIQQLSFLKSMRQITVFLCYALYLWSGKIQALGVIFRNKPYPA